MFYIIERITNGYSVHGPRQRVSVEKRLDLPRVLYDTKNNMLSRTRLLFRTLILERCFRLATKMKIYEQNGNNSKSKNMHWLYESRKAITQEGVGLDRSMILYSMCLVSTEQNKYVPTYAHKQNIFKKIFKKNVI
jgi:hypothetical protein